MSPLFLTCLYPILFIAAIGYQIYSKKHGKIRHEHCLAHKPSTTTFEAGYYNV
jgi:hypothetical protein